MMKTLCVLWKYVKFKCKILNSCINVCAWLQCFLCLYVLCFSLIHTHTALSDVDRATGVPGRFAMFAAEFTFLCESPGGGRRRQAGRTGPLTRQQRVFERVPGGRRGGLDRLWECTNHTQQRCSLPFCLFHLVFFSSWCIKFRRAQTYLYQTASHLFLCPLLWIMQSLLKSISQDKGWSRRRQHLFSFYLLFVIVFYFLYE